MSFLVDQLRLLDQTFPDRCLASYFLKFGIVFDQVDLADNPGPSGLCYRNSGMMVLDDLEDRFVYVEGVAISNPDIPLPIPHAWVYDRVSGRCLETTWSSPGFEYVGVPLDESYFRAHLLRTERWGVFTAWPRLDLTDAADSSFEEKFGKLLK